MSTSNAEKLMLMRESERLNRREFSDLVGVPYSSLSSYEKGAKEIGLPSMRKILNHPNFKKYTLWFMTDEIAPEAGQIAPVLAHFGQEGATSSHSDKKTG